MHEKFIKGQSRQFMKAITIACRQFVSGLTIKALAQRSTAAL
jgi:hypothetical protein